jgi:protein-disulfide isomerase
MKEDTKENLIAVGVVVLLAASAMWWIFSNLFTPPAQETQRLNIPTAGAPALGNENANITIVEFSDFECPFCGQYTRETFPTLKKDFIDTGRVRYVFRHFPLSVHERGLPAAKAAACADEQRKFWEYHDLLFANQESLDDESLLSYAKELDLNTDEFASCINRTVVPEQDMDLGARAGVSGTPSFFINGRKIAGALTAAEFAKELENP